jgi:hypothetical protein
MPYQYCHPKLLWPLLIVRHTSHASATLVYRYRRCNLRLKFFLIIFSDPIFNRHRRLSHKIIPLFTKLSLTSIKGWGFRVPMTYPSGRKETVPQLKLIAGARTRWPMLPMAELGQVLKG